MNNTTNTPWQWNEDGQAEFKIGNDEVVVGFSYIDDPSELGFDDDNDIVEVMFWRNNSAEVTGEGDALRIFSVVSEIMRDFQQKNKVDAFAFSANENEKSRLKLYTRIAKRIDSQAELIQNGDEVIFVAMVKH